MSVTDKLSNSEGVLVWTGVKVLLLMAAIGLVYYWRPLFHPFIYGLRYNPLTMALVGLPLAVGLLLYLAPPMTSDSGGGSIAMKGTLVGVVFGIGFVLAIIFVVGGGMFQGVAHADQTMDRSDTVETLPPMDANNPRITPREVADKQTRGSVSYRQYQLGTSDIVRAEDGSLAWSYAAEPDGLRNSIMEQQDGVVLTDMTEMSDRNINVERTDMRYGEGMWVGPSDDAFVEHQNVDWQLKKSDFWAAYYDDARPFIHDGEPYMYYPKTGHEVHWTPIPHRTVTWEGGALVHADGTIEHLSPEEARDHEALAGQPLYPYHNTKALLDDIGYRNGIWNAWFVHEDQVERADLPSGAGNDQPFVIDREDGAMSYVTTMEPFGQDTRALDEVWFTDSRTGEFVVYESNDETLIGPERAMGIARGTDTQTSWAENTDGGNFRVVEPVPVVIDEDLWWHAKVVPTDGTDVTRNIFIHASAEDGRTAELYTTDEVVEFLGGEIDPEEVDAEERTPDDADTEATDDASDSVDTEYVIVIRDENGDVVDVIPVDGDNTVGFEPADAVGNETATG